MSKQDAKRTEYFTVEVDAKVMEREHGTKKEKKR
jgi:hypothetical protein